MIPDRQAHNCPILYVVTGPTAVGKTDLTLDWAAANNAEILSCDSLLFYQGMDIGTAKPTTEERERIAHHGIDLVPASESFNVARYVDTARAAIDDMHSRGKNVLITGGSGFYIKSFFAPVVDPLSIPESVEKEVDELYDSTGLRGVVERLRQISPQDADRIDLQNPRRAIPALKRCLASGMSISQLQNRLMDAPQPFAAYPKAAVLLQRNRTSLRDRIASRTRVMLRKGLVEEVRKLRAQGFEQNPSACGSIGYREVLAMFDERLEPKELEAMITLHTDQLVSKQLKWFRTQLPMLQPLQLDDPVVEKNPLAALTEAFAIGMVKDHILFPENSNKTVNP